MLTEFFNDRVDATPQLGIAPYGGLPNETVHVSGAGHLIGLDGRALRSSWVVAPSGVKVSGTPVAEGTVDRLVLWHVPAGRVEVHAGSDHQVESQACRGTPS
jgi:hypothetical protein